MNLPIRLKKNFKLTVQKKPEPHVLFLAGIAVISVMLSTGYLYPDEHYQIIEFANALIGRGSYSQLAWEYESRIRPWLQPVFAAAFLKIGFYFTDSPFLAIKFVKAFFAASLFSAFLYYVSADGESLDGISQRARGWGGIFIATSALVAQMISRTSSEAFSAAWLMVLLGFMARSFANGKKGSHKDHLICGAIAGLMFYTRFQMGFVYAAVGMWLLLVRRAKISFLFSNLLGFALVCLLCTGLDSIIYGRVVLTPLLYFKANIIDGVASKFGVSPWYAYLFDFNTTYRAIAGAISFVAMFVLLITRPKSLLAWVFWLFVIGHSGVSHKEERFLFPAMIVAPMAWAYLIDVVSTADLGQKALANRASSSLKAFIAISAIYALLVATRPLGQKYGLLERIDERARDQQEPTCLEWAVPERPTDEARRIVPPFYSTESIRVVYTDNFSGDETFHGGCPAGHSGKNWYEVRQMTPHKYFSTAYFPRGAQECHRDNNLDALLLSWVSQEKILWAINWFKIKGEQLYLWRCG